MRYILVLIFIIAICLAAHAGQEYFVHNDGYGPVKIGLTVTEASEVLGVHLKPAAALDEDEIHCHYVYPDGNYEKIAFMVEDGVITRIDVRNKDYFTDTGISVGQSEDKVHEKYKGKVTEQVHPYIGKEGKYLIVDTKKDYQIIFETDRGVITSFRTGKLPSVSYIEGCL